MFKKMVGKALSRGEAAESPPKSLTGLGLRWRLANALAENDGAPAGADPYGRTAGARRADESTAPLPSASAAPANSAPAPSSAAPTPVAKPAPASGTAPVNGKAPAKAKASSDPEAPATAKAPAKATAPANGKAPANGNATNGKATNGSATDLAAKGLGSVSVDPEPTKAPPVAKAPPAVEAPPAAAAPAPKLSGIAAAIAAGKKVQEEDDEIRDTSSVNLDIADEDAIQTAEDGSTYWGPIDNESARAKAAGLELVIDQWECISCGTCVENTAAVFVLPDDAKAVAYRQAGPMDLIQDAIDACPVTCIHWVDDPDQFEKLNDEEGQELAG